MRGHSLTTRLVVGHVDFNNPIVVRQVLDALCAFATEIKCYRHLQVKNGRYFCIQGDDLPTEAGWYIVLEKQVPVYAGQTDNLNGRLNSNQGSLDNFANPQRKNDPERNSVTKLSEIGIFTQPRVWFVKERLLADQLGIHSLGKLDKGNVEKFINLKRGFLRFIES